MSRPAGMSKRERRALGRLRGAVADNEFLSRRRAMFAEDDRRIVEALARSAEHDRRCLEAIEQLPRLRSGFSQSRIPNARKD